MDDDWLWIVGGYLLFRALSEYDKIVPAIEQKGVQAFEMLHPSQRAHANDLPGKALTKAQLLQLATATGFPDPYTAVAIATAESGGVPNALGDIRNGQPISIGLWQINIRAHPQYTREDMSDPIKNASAAFEISKGGTDWSAWSTFANGVYQRFL